MHKENKNLNIIYDIPQITLYKLFIDQVYSYYTNRFPLVHTSANTIWLIFLRVNELKPSDTSFTCHPIITLQILIVVRLDWKQNNSTCRYYIVFFLMVGKQPTYQRSNHVEKYNQNMPTAGTGDHVSNSMQN